jgi:hypothetical protein
MTVGRAPELPALIKKTPGYTLSPIVDVNEMMRHTKISHFVFMGECCQAKTSEADQGRADNKRVANLILV